MKLYEIGTIITGNTPSRKIKEYYESNDIMFIKPGDIEEKYITNLKKSEDYISEKARNKARILPKGTVLVTCIGTIGKVGILENEATCNQQINAIIPNDMIISKYLAYLIKSKQKILQLKANAPVVPIINKTDFSKIEINICDREEQKKIVKKLDLTKKIIDIRKKQIEELRNFIKSQFVEMFGEPLISNNYGRITLDKLIRVSQGLQIPIEKRKNEKGNNSYKYITIQYLNGSKKEEYIENPNERVICSKDDVLMTRTGNTGQVITNVEGVFHNNFFKMDYDRKRINKEFLIKYFENESVYKDIIRRATTSTIPDLSHSQFYKMSIDLPPINLQNQFSEIVKQIDKQKFESMIQLKMMENIYNIINDRRRYV